MLRLAGAWEAALSSSSQSCSVQLSRTTQHNFDPKVGHTANLLARFWPLWLRASSNGCVKVWSQVWSNYMQTGSGLWHLMFNCLSRAFTQSYFSRSVLSDGRSLYTQTHNSSDSEPSFLNCQLPLWWRHRTNLTHTPDADSCISCIIFRINTSKHFLTSIAWNLTDNLKVSCAMM